MNHDETPLAMLQHHGLVASYRILTTRFGEILSGSNWYSLRILFWSSTWDSIGDKVYSGEGKRGFGKLFMCEPYMDKSPMAS